MTDIYIRNRFNKNGDSINPNNYISKNTNELQNFLNEVYSKNINNFDQNNS